MDGGLSKGKKSVSWSRLSGVIFRPSFPFLSFSCFPFLVIASPSRRHNAPQPKIEWMEKHPQDIFSRRPKQYSPMQNRSLINSPLFCLLSCRICRSRSRTATAWPSASACSWAAAWPSPSSCSGTSCSRSSAPSWGSVVRWVSGAEKPGVWKMYPKITQRT